MASKVKLLLLSVVLLPLSGCMTEDVLRYDGVTLQAGDAIAANTAMQMVDPWPVGVEDTHLLVPADRGEAESSEAEGESELVRAATGVAR
ncbi:hypothetical protein [Mesorhizobium sp. CAU 1741]|uniref:hypothetical protein n=1 Tax=Mesorhizobium sp. CAU 1741 TaxID=3140366 RepID=UPI00325A8CB3